MSLDQPQAPHPLESLSQMGAALSASQDYPTRLNRFLEILCPAAAIQRACILQVSGSDSGSLSRSPDGIEWLAGLGMSKDDFQASDQVQTRVRAALLGSPVLDLQSSLVLPLPDSAAAQAALYLEMQTRDSLPLIHAAAALLSLAIRAEKLRLENEQSRQSRQKFISVVTHELRIPMTSIKGYTDLLRQGLVGPVNADQQNFLNVIRSNVDRMSALVSDLSDLNRMETGRLRVNPTVLHLQDCINEAVDALRASIEGKRQALTLQAPGDLPAVHADHSRVVQILSALLNNAHLYTASGGRITLTARAEESQVVVAVQDTGAGISPQDKSGIFEPFFRSEDAAVREHPGWGLSLSVARGLLHLQQGRIGFESQPGQGSLFWFSLPVAGESEV
jgi:signal transduction histidine kinase